MRRSRVRLLVLVVILAGVGAYRLRGVGRVDAIAFARRGIVAHTLSSFSVIQIDDPDGNELLFPTSE